MNTAFVRYLNEDINELNNIGNERVKLLVKLGIKTFRDLLFHLPYTYIDRRYSPAIFDIKHEDLVTLRLKVTEVSIKSNFVSKTPSKILCENETGFITLVYFNNIPPYIKQIFFPGNEIVISGKVTIQNGEYTIIHPDIVVRRNETYKIPKIEPIYLKVQGLTSKLIWVLIQKVLYQVPFIDEWLPEKFLIERGWKDFTESLKILHKPQSICPQILGAARKRLAFDELLSHQICLKLLRKKIRQNTKDSLQFSGKLTDDLLNKLRFQLTTEQEITIRDIKQDQLANKKMLRLLMGDVGCGKTLVAICAALNVIEGGKQVAFMTPTKILAQQHYKNIINYTEKLGINTQILISNLKASERKKILADLENGNTNILVGTHALFQEKVKFANLGLAIIDEQHRFGVKQRMLLLEKGQHADLLMLSATPIPRTITMLNYGDMDVSIIKNKPISSTKIITTILSQSKIDELLDRIKIVIQKGERVYWVCPLIEESEKLQLSYVENTFAKLSEILGDKVAMLHGKMKTDEREHVMQEFKSGKKMVIVATTVIEVGIDIQEATIMIVENAERFGLSQLHQLRGRVGRGLAKSYCVLLHGHKLTTESKKRLSILKNYSDGFKIAEKDLEIRGSGDYLGFRQSGESGFKFFDALKDAKMIIIADEYIKNLLIDEEVPSSVQNLLQLFNKNSYFKESAVIPT